VLPRGAVAAVDKESTYVFGVHRRKWSAHRLDQASSVRTAIFLRMCSGPLLIPLPLWCGTHLRMDKPQPKDGEGLREIMRNRGGICLCGDGEAHGEEVGPRVGVSRQSLYEVG
jgi:hypothetical protein